TSCLLPCSGKPLCPQQFPKICPRHTSAQVRPCECVIAHRRPPAARSARAGSAAPSRRTSAKAVAPDERRCCRDRGDGKVLMRFSQRRCNSLSGVLTPSVLLLGAFGEALLQPRSPLLEQQQT